MTGLEVAGRSYAPGMEFQLRLAGEWAYLKFEGRNWEERVGRAQFQEGVHYRILPSLAQRIQSIVQQQLAKLSWQAIDLKVTEPVELLAGSVSQVSVQLSPGPAGLQVVPGPALIELAGRWSKLGLTCHNPIYLVQGTRLNLILSWPDNHPIEKGPGGQQVDGQTDQAPKGTVLKLNRGQLLGRAWRLQWPDTA